MSRLLAHLRWRRALKRLEREAAAAHARWMRASYAKGDVAEVFGAFSDAYGKALDESMDLMREYLALARKVERMRVVGPQ